MWKKSEREEEGEWPLPLAPGVCAAVGGGWGQPCPALPKGPAPATHTDKGACEEESRQAAVKKGATTRGSKLMIHYLPLPIAWLPMGMLCSPSYVRVVAEV